MDDILFTQPNPFSGPQISDIKATLAQASLTIAPEKIQLSSPWKYLEWVISEQHIKPQKVQLHMDIQTLNDAQKLLGDLQWLRPIVGIPNELLATLRPLLQGTDPTHRVRVSSEQRDALEKILDCVTQGQVFRRNLKLPLDLTVWNGPAYLLAAITQLLKKTGEIREPDGLNTSSMQNLPLQLTADARERIRTKASLTLLPQLLRLKGHKEHLDQRVLSYCRWEFNHTLTRIQANTTTAVIEQLAQDVDALRHLGLQNRAATDFLLLAHGHGCEDFEGMCYLNLSDHSESVHKQLRWLKQHTQMIVEVTSPLDNWLSSWGLSAWLKDIIKQGLGIVLIILLALFFGPCVFRCLIAQMEALIHAVLDKQIPLKENRG
ncbi:hypothetical protein DV515_00010720, partial [Chloebia gouldiae]